MTIQLKPGDYVSTAGITEEQYHAVAQAFVDAGGFRGDSFGPDNLRNYMLFDAISNEVWNVSDLCGYSGANRELTIDQILGTSEPAWSGEGLPPVGTVCEAFIANRDAWVEVEIKAHVDAMALFRNGTGGHFYGRTADGFRPIRTGEEKAIEEMLAFDDYDEESYDSGMMSRKDFCHALYRAGYRKTGDAK